MRRILARVTLSELASQVNAYPQWELPILELVHGGQIRIVGTSQDDSPVPSPEAEYARLERRFGLVKGTDRSRVSQAYGEGALGVSRLAEAMTEDLHEQAELDAMPEDEREMLRLVHERERVERDIVSLERRRRADGSGPEAHRQPLGRQRVELIRKQIEDERRNKSGAAPADDRQAALDAREQELAKREAELEARQGAGTDTTATPQQPEQAAAGEQTKPAEDADPAQTGRGRRRA